MFNINTKTLCLFILLVIALFCEAPAPSTDGPPPILVPRIRERAHRLATQQLVAANGGTATTGVTSYPRIEQWLAQGKREAKLD